MEAFDPLAGVAMRAVRIGLAYLLLLLLLQIIPLAFAMPGGHKQAEHSGAERGATDRALSDYVARVQARSAAEPHTLGSIWSDDGALTRLSTDVRAMHAHDLISIVVVETLSASTDGSVKNSRSSNANSQVATLFSKLSASNSLQNLLSQSSASALNAQGQSVTNSSLNTVVGGQVVQVLPNGVLVVEADRQVAFNQQTQMIRLRGLVRPSDVNPSNQVLSTAVTDLELEVVGKGIINDYTYRQNPLVRLLERLVVF
jgi:flagellar L-ring protein FlgH